MLTAETVAETAERLDRENPDAELTTLNGELLEAHDFSEEATNTGWTALEQARAKQLDRQPSRARTPDESPTECAARQFGT